MSAATKPADGDVGYPPLPVGITRPARHRFFGGAKGQQDTPATDSAESADSAESGAESGEATRRAGARSRPASALASQARPGRRAPRRHYLIVGALIVALLVPAAWSYGAALAAPGNDPAGVRSVEWIRVHHGRWLVNDIENFWYSHHKPKQGGAPKGGVTLPSTPPPTGPTAAKHPGTTVPVGPKHLPAPTPIASILPASPLAGEGVWQPLGQPVQGVPPMYATEIRPDTVYTSYLTGVVWMDPNLVKAVLYAGVQLPGGSGWRYQAPVAAADRPDLLAAFNSGFLLQDSHGGYYAEGRMVKPLVDGGATLLIRSDGTPTVGVLGRDFQMGPDVAFARQNLSLIVDNGQPVPDIGSGNISKWGATLGNKVAVWRSAVGVTASGALVYAGGAALSAPSLASVMARAGAVRAMELDINTAWVDFFTYGPPAPGDPPGSLTITKLLPSMAAASNRYLTANSRDFVALFRRNG